MPSCYSRQALGLLLCGILDCTEIKFAAFGAELLRGGQRHPHIFGDSIAESVETLQQQHDAKGHQFVCHIYINEIEADGNRMNKLNDETCELATHIALGLCC